MVHITLLGEVLSTNSLYKSHARFGHPTVYMTAKGKTLKESYQWQAKRQYKKLPTAKEIEVSIYLYFGTKRKSDWDNFNKIIMDSLTGIVFKDDSQIQRGTVEKRYDKKNPRVEIDIFPIE